jgi:phage terminase large subunit-like protein
VTANSRRFARNLIADLRRLRAEASLSASDLALTPIGFRELLAFWPVWARQAQLPPEGAWSHWLIMGGRGAGKTRAGAEWVRATALGQDWTGSPPLSPIALVGRDYDDARSVMVEGTSGVLAVHPTGQRPVWHASRRLLEWPNGAIAQVFSAESFEALRGPQFAAAWCDEIAKWRYAQEAFDQLQFALRLGPHPRQLMTTTPRATAFMRSLVARGDIVLTGMASAENAAHLAPGFVDRLNARYGGTRLGRQEIEGELIADREDTLFPRASIELARRGVAPRLMRIVVAIDPAATSHAASDACGIIVAGRAEGDRFYVLEDATRLRASPMAWARAAIAAYHRHQADRVVAEVNQGGEMVAAVLQMVDGNVPLRLVRATRGKWLRAEPIAALYEQGRVHHVGALTALEDEMADFGLDGLSNGRSPDRLDALVWALTDLSADRHPQIRAV